MGEMDEVEIKVDAAGVQAPREYSGLSLALRVCPTCGRHGQVLITEDSVVINTIAVQTRSDALELHAELLRGGGQEQSEFLREVSDATYLQDNPGGAFATFLSMIAFGRVMEVFGDAGAVISRIGRDARQTSPQTRRRENDPLRDLDLSQATLALQQCFCQQHGVVVLKLPTGGSYDVGFPVSKADACDALDRLILRYPSFPDGQEEFLRAVEAADYLTGPMPVQLL